MIIDVHYHQIPILPDDMVEGLIKDPIRAAKIIGKSIDEEELFNKARKYYVDRNGKKLIKTMDEANIDFTIIVCIDNATKEGITPDLVQLQNKMVADVAKKYPERCMALAGVDPRRPEALDMLKQCFEEYGMKGLKYHSDYGFDPSGPESYELLGYLEKNKGILLAHTGPMYPPARNKFADPMLLSDIGVDFPDLTVIAAHMGQINWRRWANLAQVQPNLYGDLSMWAPFAFGRFKLFCRELRDIIDYVGKEKVLFGSDGPIFNIVIPVKDWIDKLKSLPDKAPSGIKFTQEEIDAILGENAVRVLEINK